MESRSIHSPFYLVTDTLDIGLEEGHLWDPRPETIGLCRKCGSTLTAHMPKPLDLYLNERPRGVEPHAHGWGILPTAILDVVLPLTSGHVRGRCFQVTNGTPQEIKEYGTLYPLPEAAVRLRGGPKSRYPVCTICGTRCTIALEPRYLLAHYLHPGRATIQDDSRRLYVNDRIAETIERLGYPDLVLRPMPVMEKPLDSEWLPGDPNWWADE